LLCVFIVPAISFAKEGTNDVIDGIREKIQNFFAPTTSVIKKNNEEVRQEIKSEEKKQEKILNEKNNIKPKLADDSDMRQGGFCFQIPTFAGKIETQITEREAELLQKRNEREAETEIHKSVVEDKVSNRRTEWDDNRLKNFEKIESRATTEAQKTAIQKFRTAIDEAVRTRRETFDSAMQGFRSGISDSANSREEKIDAIVKAYQSAIANALEKMKIDCANGIDAKTSRMNFQTSTKAAKEHFDADKKVIEKITLSIQALSTERKSALLQANIVFKTKIDKATEEFKKSF
jgi:hypothetical protein